MGSERTPRANQSGAKRRTKSRKEAAKDLRIVLPYLSPSNKTVVLCSSPMDNKTILVGSPCGEKRPVYLGDLIIGYETVSPKKVECQTDTAQNSTGDVSVAEVDEPELIQLDQSEFQGEDVWEESSLALSPPLEFTDEVTILWRPPTPSECLNLCNICGIQLEDKENAATFIKVKGAFHCLTCNEKFSKFQLAKHKTACFLTFHQFFSPEDSGDDATLELQEHANDKLRMVACDKCVDTIKILVEQSQGTS